MKYYITKYALSSGIDECEGQISNTSENMLVSKTENGYTTCFHGKDWHDTKESAIKQANEMRERKIKSLEKQIEKLKKLNF